MAGRFRELRIMDLLKNVENLNPDNEIIVKDLPDKGKIFIHTASGSMYIVTKCGKDLHIQGGARFRLPMICKIHGCTLGGSAIMLGKLSIGMRMEFSGVDPNHDGNIIKTWTTSPIEQLEIVRPIAQ